MELKKNERINGYTVELEIGVSKEEFEAGLEQAYRKNVGQIQIPGFRKGKAPRKMIEKMYGATVFYEDGVNLAYPAAYEAAIEAAGIIPVDQAELDIVDLSADGFTFKATVTVRPEVSVDGYKDIRVEKHQHEIGDEAVEEEIRRMAERSARIETVEREAQSGDLANIDYEGSVDGVPFDGGKAEGYDLKLGSGTFIPGFEDQIIGHKAGDEFDVKVTFPEEYHSEELAGKEAVFKTVLHEVKESILPEIDDEFAKDVSEYDTIEELRKETRENLEKANEAHVEQAFESEIFEKVAELVKDEIPEVMFNNTIDNLVQDFAYRMSMQGIGLEQYMQMTGTTMEQFRENFRDRAVQQVKVGLALEAIAKLEGFDATEEEVDAEYEKLATEQMTVEQIKTYLNAASVKQDIITEKVINLLKEVAAQ
ncbi:MAG: trigger factor [Ruminococcaceae bacterium]|nr:trigger factor [Oscillospiraceae bacterium]